MTDYTKGLLTLIERKGPQGSNYHEIFAGDKRITINTKAADCRRLVACWNALLGVDTEFLERVPQSPGFTIVQLLTQERDELIEALKTLLDGGSIWQKDEHIARAILAKHAPKVAA